MYRFIAFPDTKNRKNNLQEILEEVETLPEYSCAYIKLLKGTYKGQFFFDGNRKYPGTKGVSIVIKGRGKRKTVISGSLSASEILDDGLKRGTFRTYTAYFGGPCVELQELTIENTSGPYTMQGIALYAAAEQFICKKVGIDGYQDTLFLAPLPAAEREKGGFRGPGESALRKPTLQLYERCTVTGTVDFVFGGAAALFSNCKFVVRNVYKADSANSKKYYVAAPCSDTPFSASDCSSGFFFKKCSFTVQNATGLRHTDVRGKQESVYLARPWRPFGRCFFFYCRIGKDFDPELWHVWNSDEDKLTAGFYLCGKTDAADWGNPLSADEKYELLHKIERMTHFAKNYKKL